MTLSLYTILAVNDDENILQQLTAALKEIGFSNVMMVIDSNSAWAVLQSKKIDCVISAYEMDEISGPALLKRVRREAGLADLPFFLTDAAFTKIKVLTAGQTGVTGLFVIPFKTQNIQQKLSAARKQIKDPVVEQTEQRLEKGLQCIESGQYDQALEIFQSLVSQRENPEYFFNIGFIKTNQGQHKEAIDAFYKATQLDRLFVKAYEAMAKAYEAMGNIEKTQECMQVAAEIYIDTDKLVNAEEILHQILESGSHSLNVFNTLGVLHRKKGDTENALRHYKKALKVHPDEPYIYYNIGRLYLDMKNAAEAKTYFQTALDKDHEFEEAKQVLKAIDLGFI